MNNFIVAKIANLFEQTYNHKPESITKLPESGSSRIYYRVKSIKNIVIATFNKDTKENNAFLYYSKLFKNLNINVPEIIAADIENNIYMQEDLGNEMLFDRILKYKSENEFAEEIVRIYKEIIKQLIELQINTSSKIDYSYAYPRAAFDKQSIMWDLNYFKYQFVKYTDVAFDEQLLEDDFNKFSEYLLKTDTNYFLFRDFQSRNIMLNNDKIYFIDYQGGRKGALQYDLASLLFDAKAEIPLDYKNSLLDYYLNEIQKYKKIDAEEFKEFYFAYALIRILQAMGAYGYRGLYEKKQIFIDSIVSGLANLRYLISQIKTINEFPELKKVILKLLKSEKLSEHTKNNKLKVSIQSFSFKRGIPYDATGNGGGHVFDCRFISNPGKIEKFKSLCGKDIEIIEFLDKTDGTQEFIKSIKQITKASIENYTKRHFKNLSISFGCTGGQHRSVYFAEKIAAFIKENFDVNIELIHKEGF
jgi:aminoglycoside/choline kinase family phosphotransferase